MLNINEVYLYKDVLGLASINPKDDLDEIMKAFDFFNDMNED